MHISIRSSMWVDVCVLTLLINFIINYFLRGFQVMFLLLIYKCKKKTFFSFFNKTSLIVKGLRSIPFSIRRKPLSEHVYKYMYIFLKITYLNGVDKNTKIYTETL